jgi:hypothetical protein
MDLSTQQAEKKVDVLYVNSMASLQKNVLGECSKVSEPFKSGHVYR